MKHFNPETVQSVDDVELDQPFTLADLATLFLTLSNRFGADTVVSFDAGYNNVGLVLGDKWETGDNQ